MERANVDFLFGNLLDLTWQHVVMWCIGGLLIYLAIAKDMEPTLLLPIGFGTLLVNIPNVDLIQESGALMTLFNAGIANELFPLILFIGIGAMIDFGPLLSNPKLMFFGAAAQFGIFFTLCMASMFFDINDAASIAVIGAADGPTSIVVAQALGSKYLGAIMVAAYSYMALVPIIQPPIIRLLTTRKERLIRVPYEQKNVSRATRILFPIVLGVDAVGIDHQHRIDIGRHTCLVAFRLAADSLVQGAVAAIQPQQRATDLILRVVPHQIDFQGAIGRTFAQFTLGTSTPHGRYQHQAGGKPYATLYLNSFHIAFLFRRTLAKTVIYGNLDARHAPVVVVSAAVAEVVGRLVRVGVDRAAAIACA